MARPVICGEAADTSPPATLKGEGARTPPALETRATKSRNDLVSLLHPPA